MTFNTNGISTIVNASDDLFMYLAYGSGTVADNATSLTTEITRADTPTVITKSNYFDLQFSIDETTSNGNTILEYGLATANSGDISSTDNYAPIEKIALIYVLANIRTIVNNL